MLGYFGNDVDVHPALARLDMQRLEDGGKMPVKFNVDDRTNDLDDLTDLLFRRCFVRHCLFQHSREFLI